jgi:hypothetical protein
MKKVATRKKIHLPVSLNLTALVQITNCYIGARPESFTVATGTCYEGAYAFQSFAETTNFDSGSNQCALFTYSEANCQGTGAQASLSELPTILCQNLNAPATSFQLLNCS